ncbi:MAG: hypothetical protein AB7S70_10125 [Hyphomicrobium sp.]
MTGSVNWLTPKLYIDALGPFDLDPCAPIEQPFPTAARVFTIHDNGLIQSWRDPDAGDLRVWLNPPYARHLIAKWIARITAILGPPTDKLLEHLTAIWPNDCTREELATACNYSINTNAVKSAIVKIKDMGFASYPAQGRIRAEDKLFPDGIAA